MEDLQETLKDVQLRLSVAQRRHLTHGDLAGIANVSSRALGEWMRGKTAPVGMTALLRLLSQLPANQVQEVLSPWRVGGAKSPLPQETPNSSDVPLDLSIDSTKASQ